MPARIALVLCFVASLMAQVPSVNQVSGPPPAPFVSLDFYDGTGNLQYVCKANQFLQTPNTVQKSDSSLTSIAVATNVGTVTTLAAHGAWVGMRVTVSGSATTALNGTYVVKTVPSSTTYTITTSGVGDATYTDAGLVIATSNPLTTQSVWAIQVLTYSGSSLSGTYWANSSVGLQLACSNRANY